MMTDGVVAETGAFSELVARRGAFFALAKSHLKGSDGDETSPAGAEAGKAPSPAAVEALLASRDVSSPPGGLQQLVGQQRGPPARESPSSAAAHTAIDVPDSQPRS
jgi:hypothetical protein